MHRKEGKFGFGLHDIKVSVQRSVYMDALDIVIWMRSMSGVYHMAKPMKLEFEAYKQDTALREPTLQLSGDIAGDLLDALVGELGDKGIKTKNDSKTEGLLEAQTEHLKDLQSIVFKGKKK